MRKIFLTVLIAVIAFSVSSAQKTYQWEQYKLSFTVPENMEIVENTESSFIAEGQDIRVGVVPIEYENFKKDDAVELFEKMAKSMNLNMTNSASKKFNGTNCGGSFIVATSNENPDALGIVALAASEVSKICVCVMVIMTEEKAEDAGNILGSLTFE